MTRLTIFGIAGRMGQCILDAVDDANLADGGEGIAVYSGIEGRGKEVPGLKAALAKRGVKLFKDPAKGLKGTDVAVEFINHPADTPVNVSACVAAGVPILVGTTGHDGPQLEQIMAAAEKIPLIVAQNTSLGVNLLFALVSAAARVLPTKYDVELSEAHHRGKIDAPSGTAKGLLERIYSSRPDPGTELVYGRKGISPREKGEIGVHSLRLGRIVGDHEVRFCGDYEEITLSHRALDRKVFALGALKAASFLHGKPAGIYTMANVLGLE